MTLVLQFGCDCSDPDPGQINPFHQTTRLYFFIFKKLPLISLI